MLPTKLIDNINAVKSAPLKGIFKRDGAPVGAVHALFKGLICAVLFAAAASLLLAMLFCWTDMSSRTMHILQLPILGLAAFIGAFVAAKAAGRKGLAQGLRLAVLMLALLAVLTASGGGQLTLAAVLLKGLILIVCGALGGMFGVF